MRRKLARQRIELSQLVRLLEFTPKIEERLVSAMTQAQRRGPLDRDARSISSQRSLERKRTAEENKEIEKKLRAAKRHLTQLEEKHHASPRSRSNAPCRP